MEWRQERDLLPLVANNLAQGNVLLGVIWTLNAIAFVTLALRIGTSIKVMGRLSISDMIMIWAGVSSVDIKVNSC